MCASRRTRGPILTTYEGEIFDSGFNVVHKFPLPGTPSRVRLSPDGKIAATTSFVTGDSYAQAGFSTRTLFVDTTTGTGLSNLEGFKVTDGDHEVTAVSANYWGVTFEADSDHFYATLGIGTSIQMIEGSVRARTAHTVHDDVECPGLSPDQTRDRVQAARRRRVQRSALAPARARHADRTRRRARRDP